MFLKWVVQGLSWAADLLELLRHDVHLSLKQEKHNTIAYIRLRRGPKMDFHLRHGWLQGRQLLRAFNSICTSSAAGSGRV